jgi:iron complex transport system permease protein
MRSSITRDRTNGSTTNGVLRFGWLVGASVVALALLALAALSIGPYHASLGDLIALLWRRMAGDAPGDASPIETVLLQIRGPRVLAAMMVGGALAASGAAYQSLFRNPLVSPDILGVSSGAARGAVVGIYLGLPILAIQGLAFAGGLAAVAVVTAIAAAIPGRDPVLVLVLGGIVVGALLGSCVALMKFLADPYNQLPAITFWLLGSLSSIHADDLRSLAPAVLLALAPLLLLRWRIDVMTLGDEEARALGVDPRAIRIAVIAGATLMTAAAVSVSGIVGWVGLVVPHLVRLIVGPAFVRLLPMAVLVGACYLLAVDTVARTLGTVELPLGVLTAALGTPLFLWLLAFGRRDGP